MAMAPLAKYKVVILGDKFVGKTSIISAFMYQKFNTAYQATIGIDFLSKTMYLENDTIRFQLWDTAGHETFRSLIPSYIKDSSVAVIVYDVTNRQSFLSIATWIRDVHNELGTDDVIIVLVGNKTDLVDKRQVAIEEGDAKAREYGIMFIETSAKEEFNTKRLFRNIADVLLETHSSTKQEDKVGVKLEPSDNVPSTPVVTSSQSAQGSSLDNKNITDLENVSSPPEVQHSKNNHHVSSCYTSNAQELKVGDFAEANTKTNDHNNSLTMMSNNENKIKDDMDKRPSSKLERMMEEMLKRMDEIQEVKGRCQSLKVYDQRCDDMLKRMEDVLKRMEETQKGNNRRVDEHIHEVEGRSPYDQRFENMLKRMEEMEEGNRRMDERIKEVERLVERGRLDDIKRWEDMSKKLADMANNMFRRLEKLESHKDYTESSEPLKILQHKKGEDGDDDIVFV